MAAAASFSYKIGGGGLISYKIGGGGDKDLATLLAAVLTWSGYWPIFNIKQWGTHGNRGFQGEGRSPTLSKSSKKSVKKSQKLAKSEKNLENSDFFFTENGLKCIRNPTKNLYKSTICKKKKKIGKIWRKKKNKIFFTENGLKYIRKLMKHL